MSGIAPEPPSRSIPTPRVTSRWNASSTSETNFKRGEPADTAAWLISSRMKTARFSSNIRCSFTPTGGSWLMAVFISVAAVRICCAAMIAR